MTAATRRKRPVKYALTDIILGVYDDGPAATHLQITVTPASTLWASGCYHEKFDSSIDELAALPAHHLVTGLLARLALRIEEGIDLERVLHGCTRPSWYAEKPGRQHPRRLGLGDSLADGETPLRDGWDCCHIAPDLDSLWEFALYVSVPRQRVSHWKKRISGEIDYLVGEVPQ